MEDIVKVSTRTGIETQPYLGTWRDRERLFSNPHLFILNQHFWLLIMYPLVSKCSQGNLCLNETEPSRKKFQVNSSHMATQQCHSRNVHTASHIKWILSCLMVFILHKSQHKQYPFLLPMERKWESHYNTKISFTTAFLGYDNEHFAHLPCGPTFSLPKALEFIPLSNIIDTS